MMCHRTGLPRHDLSWYASWATREEFLKRIQYLEPTAELSEKWQYNNFMFMAQGVVIEKLTGKSWEENMKEKILKPLGMDNTNLSTKDMEKTPDHSLAFATKDSSIKVIPYRNIDAMGPAGSVNSSAKDMAKWLITWINNGKYNGKEIFPHLHIAMMLSRYKWHRWWSSRRGKSGHTYKWLWIWHGESAVIGGITCRTWRWH